MGRLCHSGSELVDCCDERCFAYALVVHGNAYLVARVADHMPRLRTAAVLALMAKRNIATKFELSQVCGIAYGRLRELLEGAETAVGERELEQLCRCLRCAPEAISGGGGRDYPPSSSTSSA